MKTFVVIIVVLAAAGALAFWMVSARPAQAPGTQACTMEAKLCPDGSAVGRAGPNCEFSACPSANTSTTTTLTVPKTTTTNAAGVRGSVLLGPTCPVERIPPDPQCAPKPYATTIVVHRTGSSATLATGKSDAQGAFEFSLPPGSYTLSATGGTMLPRCAPVDVVVPATGYATTTISCDTGIR